MNPCTHQSDRTNRRRLFLYTCLTLTAVAVAQDEAAEHDATPYTLVWADEFDTPGRPDPNRWTYERGFVRNEEYYRGHLLANACWGDERRWSAIWDTGKKPVTDFNDPHWDRRFHVWRMDWDKQAIRLYVDDLLLNTIELDKTINRDGEGKNPFHEPHYLLVNLAIGGTNGGDPSETAFPTRYEIDYVRVYQETH